MRRGKDRDSLVVMGDSGSFSDAEG